MGSERRGDAKFCGVRCRQAAWRFRRFVRRREAAESPIKVAYADPPYPGCESLYAVNGVVPPVVDLAVLVDRLERDFPDGWALSTSAAALPGVLRLCPVDVRVAAWFRGGRGVAACEPVSAWEPVICRGGRRSAAAVVDGRLDSLVFAARARTADPFRVVGSKPGAFCFWLFDLLGLRPGDGFVDLFPGSGRVLDAWDVFVGGGSLFGSAEAGAAGS